MYWLWVDDYQEGSEIMKTGLIFSLIAVFVIVLVAAQCGSSVTPQSTPVQDSGSSGSMDGMTLLQERCTECHGLERVDVTKNEAQWKTTIDRMVAKGADLTGDEVDFLAGYLAERQPK
jgi:hypothetical protein